MGQKYRKTVIRIIVHHHFFFIRLDRFDSIKQNVCMPPTDTIFDERQTLYKTWSNMLVDGHSHNVWIITWHGVRLLFHDFRRNGVCRLGPLSIVDSLKLWTSTANGSFILLFSVFCTLPLGRCDWCVLCECTPSRATNHWPSVAFFDVQHVEWLGAVYSMQVDETACVNLSWRTLFHPGTTQKTTKKQKRNSI